MSGSMPEVKKSLIEKTLGKSVSKVEVSEGAKPGDNSLGSVLAIKVTTKSKQDIRLIYKGMPKLSPEKKKHIVEAGFFRTENTLYKAVVPKLEELLRSVGGGANDQLPLARYYGGKNDDDNDYLVLEDLRQRGYQMSDKISGMNAHEVMLTMRALAEFHATTYCLVQNEGQKLFRTPEMKTFVESFFSNSDPARMIRKKLVFRFHLTNAMTLLEENGHEELAERVGRHCGDEALERLGAESQEATDAKHFPCIVQGDLWVNNILFKYNAGRRSEPVDVKFIDFQLARRGHVYEDLGYFFMTSTTREFREEHLARALFVYYDTFVRRLEALGCPSPANFTRGVFIDRYFGNLLAAYAFCCFTIPLQLCEPSDVPLMDAGDERRSNGDLGRPPKVNGDLGSPIKANGDLGRPASGDAFVVPDEHKDLYRQAQVMLRQMRRNPWVVRRIIEIAQELAALGLL